MKAEKVFEVAGQKNVGMTVAYAISDGSTGYYAAKILAPNETYAAAEWFTAAELYEAFVAGSLVIATVSSGSVATYERVSKMTVASTTYSGPTTTVGVNPGT